MKNFFTLLVLLCVAAGAGYYFNADFERLVDSKVLNRYNIQKPALNNPEHTGYKWRNEKGEWQLTQTPPPEGVPYEEVKVRTDWNVMDPVR